MTGMVFLDASYVIALRARSDQHHGDADRHWKLLKSGRPRLVTTSMVVAEVVTILNARGQHEAAVDAGRRLISGEGGLFLFVEEPLFQEGFRYLESRRDKGYSLADCVSFLVMEKRSIRDALTFDHHFARAGFRMLPGS